MRVFNKATAPQCSFIFSDLVVSEDSGFKDSPRSVTTNSLLSGDWTLSGGELKNSANFLIAKNCSWPNAYRPILKIILQNGG